MLLGTLFWLLLGGEPVHARTENLSTPVFCTAVSGCSFYAPNLQRWLNRDPLEEDVCVNLYCIANNNVINGVDVNGLYTFNPTCNNCLGYASGVDAGVSPSEYPNQNGKCESLKEIVESLGFKSKGPITKEYKALCDQDIMIVYIYINISYYLDPWKDPWIYDSGISNDFHAIRRSWHSKSIPEVPKMTPRPN